MSQNFLLPLILLNLHPLYFKDVSKNHTIVDKVDTFCLIS